MLVFCPTNNLLNSTCKFGTMPSDGQTYRGGEGEPGGAPTVGFDRALAQLAAQSLVRRARIIVMSADGVSNGVIAQCCEVSVPTVSHWRRCWRERGVAGLHGDLRPGRPRSYDDERVAALMRNVLHNRPSDATHWSVRRAAAASGISKSTVARYFALFGIQTHRSKKLRAFHRSVLRGKSS